MTYEDLIKTVSTIVENENIYKQNLTLTYELDEIQHNDLNRTLFYKINSKATPFIANDEFEAEIDGIIVKFKKKIL